MHGIEGWPVRWPTPHSVLPLQGVTSIEHERAVPSRARDDRRPRRISGSSGRLSFPGSPLPSARPVRAAWHPSAFRPVSAQETPSRRQSGGRIRPDAFRIPARFPHAPGVREGTTSPVNVVRTTPSIVSRAAATYRRLPCTANAAPSICAKSPNRPDGSPSESVAARVARMWPCRTPWTVSQALSGGACPATPRPPRPVDRAQPHGPRQPCRRASSSPECASPETSSRSAEPGGP